MKYPFDANLVKLTGLSVCDILNFVTLIIANYAIFGFQFNLTNHTFWKIQVSILSRSKPFSSTYMIVLSRCYILPALLLIGIHSKAQQPGLLKELPVDTIPAYSEIDTDLSYSRESVSSVKIDLSKVKCTNELSVPEFLQGRVSGLDISNFSTDPGESAQVILRGQKFNIYQNPLIVIDGIPRQSLKRFSNSTYNGSKIIQSLIPVPLEDIQSIEVLKDGTSTLLYGPEGANGVILIETKKGTNQKMSLTYQFNQSIVNSPSYMPMLNGNEYVHYQTEAWYNRNGNIPIPPEISLDPDGIDYYNYSANTDWMKEVTQPGNAANHQLSLSGGNEKNRLYGSINYHDEKGTVINTGTKRLLNRMNFEHYFTKNLTLALNLSYATTKDDGNGSDILGLAFKKAPNMSVWKLDNEGNKTGSYFTPYNDYQRYYNPVALSETSNSLITTNDLMTTAHLQYKIFDWLRLRETLSYNNLSNTAKSNFYYSSMGQDTLVENTHKTSATKFERLHNEIQTLVKVPFKNERINALTGTVTWIRWNDKFSNDDKKYYIDQLRDSSGQSYDRKINALVFAVHSKFYNRYILTANIRQETNPRVRDIDKRNKFYGASLAWRFSEEPLFKNHILNNGLISAGYSYSEYLSKGGSSLFYLYSYNISNSNPFKSNFPLDWKNHTPSYDASIELELLDNRLHISTNYYYMKPEINYYFFDLPLPLKMKTNGWEWAVDYTIISRKNLTWSLQFNVAHNEQILEKTLKGLNGEPFIMGDSGYGTYMAEGKPLGLIYGFQREGVYASDQDAYAKDKRGNIYYNDGQPLPMKYESYIFRGGDTKYKDINYDGMIDNADLVYLGNSKPDYTGGFGSTIRFKNLVFTCNFHYQTGNEIINQTAMDAEGLYGFDNKSKTVLNRWRVQGQQGPELMPRAFMVNTVYSLPSDRYVESGSFVRMNYLDLGYAFNPAFCHKINVKDLSLDLSGQRLYTYSKYSGLNPETEITNKWLNIDISKISLPAVYTLSIKITI